ncbi:hypothetical protein NQ315_001983 [Exocentrus adspersus]|uniref:Uncharacterized protein n=1 Tax=Exocentrus adspersus TaxID=1586481 RepID=A0AAV8W9X9_9CUCU|nr:hypothetical protein NQ315_001983 [Exocentrus adspersus]
MLPFKLLLNNERLPSSRSDVSPDTGREASKTNVLQRDPIVLVSVTTLGNLSEAIRMVHPSFSQFRTLQTFWHLGFDNTLSMSISTPNARRFLRSVFANPAHFT